MGLSLNQSHVLLQIQTEIEFSSENEHKQSQYVMHQPL